MRLLVAALIAAVLLGPWDRAAELADRGDLEGAEREFRTLAEEDPDNPALAYNIGTVLLMQGRYDEARTELERAAANLPADGTAAYNIGNTDLEPAYADSSLTGRDDRLRRSIAAYRRALIQNPDDPDAKWNLELAQKLLERRTPPPESGGGGGGGAGGGGGGAGSSGAPQPPTPRPAGGAGAQPDMSPAEAERLLDAAQAEEGEVQRNALRRPQPPGPIRP